MTDRTASDFRATLHRLAQPLPGTGSAGIGGSLGAGEIADPEAITAAEFFAKLLHDYGPDGVISYTYEQVLATLKAGRANYSPNGQIFLVQMGAKDSKVANTCNFSIARPGRRGGFPA